MTTQFIPDGMNIELTTACPFRCPQCYCSLEGGKNIDPELAVRMIWQGAEMGVSHVELSGGETMCYPHLLEIVAEARKAGVVPSIAISGWHFDAEILNRLTDAGIGTIYVSLNGSTKEKNAASREGYEYAIHALEVLAQNKFPETYINWVMHRGAVEDLGGMIRLAEQYHAAGILIIDPKPTSAGMLETSPTPAQMREVAEHVRHNQSGIDLLVQHCFSPLLALSKENKLWGNLNRGVYKGCTAGICSFSVNVDGLFSPCRHLDYFEKWDSVEEYWTQSKILENIRQLDRDREEPCASCQYEKYCRPCLAVNSKIKGKLALGNPFCELPKL